MYKKVLAYLALTLGIAEVGVVLVSWLLTAAMPESFTHSLTSPEGIRWFTGHFVDHLTSAWLVWLVLISISIGVVRQSRVLHFDHTQYRQRTALRLMLFELVFFCGHPAGAHPHAPCHSAECRRHPLSGSIHAESHSVHLFFGRGDEHELWHHEREHQGHQSGL